MKKLTFVAALVAFSVPMAASAVTLNSAKNSVTVKSVVWKTADNAKPGYNCYGFKFSGSGKATPVTIPGLAADIDLAGDVVLWNNDFLLNNINTSTNGTPNNVPQTPVVINGLVTGAKGANKTITWDDPNPVTPENEANLMMAKSLIDYANAFPEFLGNATLATTQANGKPLDVKKPNYSFTVTVKGTKTSIKEVALLKSTQGACVAYATITRVYSTP